MSETDGRILMKDGQWLVPPAERPRGWERYDLTEPTPNLDAVVAQAEATCKQDLQVQPPAESVRTLESDRADFQEMKDAISLEAPGFGATEDIVVAAWVMVAGIWRRKPSDIMVMIGYRAQLQHIKDIAVRFWRTGIWTDDGLVVLGEMDGTPKAALEFWLNAMVGAGVIQGEYREDEGMFYWAHDARRAG